MSGTGFDYECSSLSPEGRIFQVEYAEKAVETSSTILGVRCKNGIVLGTEKIVLSKMMVAGTDKRVFSITTTTGSVVNGLTPDGKSLVYRGREEAVQYEKMFGIKIPIQVLAERLAMRTQMNTIYNGIRPYGTSIILAGNDHIKGLGLYMIEPSGQCFEYYGCASGRGKQLARNEIEKVNFREMSVDEAIPLIAKILLKAQEEMKDKKQELEISIISDTTGYKHKILDRVFVDQLTLKAQEEIENEQMEMA
ncbi:proteasome subunit alpha type 3 [Stylonychia lemnae]|uniref:Proteasome subunit alpha type 3 n=1 Tax=Stylonychia lemnae TaxID=5949 RepID=A0A077ZS00_STYLE|nr:proteasome subunit alpha type 3 [Stylonychia lemnae]|eukprot:CDW72662.1 proteasome subunit alpha type 3 [Stylonychia lemnae]